jgi:hypothetical protein
MGPGWNLTGLSAIVRCGKTWASTGGTATVVGTPTGVSLATSDDVCMDGNRLRVVTGAATTPAAGGNTYSTEIADFSQITSYGTQGNGAQYFLVRGKDGRTYEYGNTADSRIFGGAATTPYAWALNKIRDRQGNAMTLNYTTGATIPTLANIQYTTNANGAAPYQVTFNYVARTGGTTISKYVAGYPVSLANQLDNVTVTASGVIVRKYQLAYSASATTSRSLLQTMQECGGSAGTDCLRPTTLSYQSGATGWSSTAVNTGINAQYGIIPADLNGDGIPDMIYAKLSGSTLNWYARIGSASGVFGAEISIGASTGTTVGALTSVAPYVANFLGTQRAQILAPVVTSSGTFLYCYSLAANGTSFTAAATTLLAANYAGFQDYGRRRSARFGFLRWRQYIGQAQHDGSREFGAHFQFDGVHHFFVF